MTCPNCSTQPCPILTILQDKTHAVEKITIFHPGHEFPDEIRISITTETDDATGCGTTLQAALVDLERQLKLDIHK